MLEKEWLISGLKRQYDLLSDLINQMENKPFLDSNDSSFYDERTKQIEKNLKRLRKLRGTLSENV